MDDSKYRIETCIPGVKIENEDTGQDIVEMEDTYDPYEFGEYAYIREGNPGIDPALGVEKCLRESKFNESDWYVIQTTNWKQEEYIYTCSGSDRLKYLAGIIHTGQI